MTTFGDPLYHLGGVPVGGVFTTAKKNYFVKPGSGSDSNSGRDPEHAMATLAGPKAAMSADDNAVVYLVAEDNSASGTTNRISGATFTWTIDGSTIQGVAAGNPWMGQRARISNTADTTDVSPLMAWSASNASMRNVHIFYGENDAGDLGAFQVSGERNYFYQCHIAGIGHATQDATGAYSLNVTGSENLFEECVIGIDTIGRGTAACSELLLSGGATRNVFKDCTFLTYAEAAAHQFLIQAASGIDRFTQFINCRFLNSGTSTMTEAFDIAAGGSPSGGYVLHNCMLVGATEWDAGDEGNIWIVGAAGTAATSGIAVEPAV